MIKAVLLDLGGVVYVGDAPLPGAVEAVARLRAAGLAVRFVTNITRQSRRALGERLVHMGIELGDDELFMPAIAARRYLESRRLRPHLLVHPASKEDFAGLTEGEREAVVIGDAGKGFTYAALNGAFRAVSRGADLVALASNRAFRDDDGALSLDAGAFVAALEYASEREAIVLGKPAPDFFQLALDSIGCAANEVAMVGDDVEFDVAAAMAAGLSGLLVRTGKYWPGAERKIDPPPTAVLDDLPAAVGWLLARQKG